MIIFYLVAAGVVLGVVIALVLLFTEKRSSMPTDVLGAGDNSSSEEDVPKATAFPFLKKRLEKAAESAPETLIKASSLEASGAGLAEPVKTIDLQKQLKESSVRSENLEKILKEKNEKIQTLEAQLSSDASVKGEFNKIKDLQESEILQSKEKMRSLQAQLEVFQSGSKDVQEKIRQYEEKVQRLERAMIDKEQENLELSKRVQIMIQVNKGNAQSPDEEGYIDLSNSASGHVTIQDSADSEDQEAKKETNFLRLPPDPAKKSENQTIL